MMTYRYKTQSGFTLIEILVVVTIISILLGLVIFAGTGALKSALISRTRTEIGGMKSALTAYKIDNGAFPVSTSLSGPPAGNYPTPSGPADPAYTLSSQVLFSSLAGRTSFTSTTLTGKVYFPFTSAQVGNPSGNTYVQDPFQYSYGYSTQLSATQYPNGGPAFYDIWSVGPIPMSTNVNTWVTSWQQ